MSEELHTERVKAEQFPSQAERRSYGGHAIDSAWPRQAESGDLIRSVFYQEYNKTYNRRTGSRVCGPKKLLVTFGYKSNMKKEAFFSPGKLTGQL